MIYLRNIFLVIYWLLILGIMVKILLDNRQPTKTMAWMLVLWFLPVVGILLYIFFGQDTRRQRFISQRSLDQLSKRSMLEFVSQRNLKVPPSQQQLVKMFANLNQALPFKDNTTQIFTNGYEFFPALLRDIARARYHIHIEMFIFANDALGQLIADALIDKARQGVEIRVLYDDVGCWNVKSSFFERMRDEGIIVHAFMPVKFPAFTSKANYRNHRKICVIDGHAGYIGGFNIAMRYVKGFGSQPWRDTMMRIEGGAVYALQRAFLVDWYFVEGTLITNHKYYPPLRDVPQNDVLCQVVTSSPISPWPDIMQGYVRILLQARQYVYIETPYFLPTETFFFAMKAAALAGVDVRLMMPIHSDAKLVEMASYSYLPKALEAGIKIYLYKGGFNHSKLLISDDMVSSCGSTNIDFRSFENNFEGNAFFYGSETASALKQVFLNDMKQCDVWCHTTDVPRPGLPKRILQSLVRLLAPVM